MEQDFHNSLIISYVNDDDKTSWSVSYYDHFTEKTHPDLFLMNFKSESESTMTDVDANVSLIIYSTRSTHILMGLLFSFPALEHVQRKQVMFDYTQPDHNGPDTSLAELWERLWYTTVTHHLSLIDEETIALITEYVAISDNWPYEMPRHMVRYAAQLLKRGIRILNAPRTLPHLLIEAKQEEGAVFQRS